MESKYDCGRLILGDCMDAMASMKSGSVPLVVTSPPYNLGGRPWPKLGNWKPGDAAGGSNKWRNGPGAGAGIQYNLHNDSMPHAEYVEWQRSVIRELWRLIPDDGAIFYNHKPRVIGARLWLPLELIPEEAIVRQIITWLRPGGINANATAFMPTTEWIIILAKPKFRLKSRGVSCVGDAWMMTPDRNPHPAPFPLQLPRTVFEAVDAGMVLDPFCGSGTTCVAAIRDGLEFVGIEKDAKYYEMAKGRIEHALNPGLFA